MTHMERSWFELGVRNFHGDLLIWSRHGIWRIPKIGDVGDEAVQLPTEAAALALAETIVSTAYGREIEIVRCYVETSRETVGTFKADG